MRNYTNARGAGHILKIELIDNQGTQIEGTFFNEQALTNNSTLEENKVYLISGGQIKIANKKFTSISNDFCITFDKNTTIEEASDDESIGAQGFCFVSIDQINEFEQNRTVDTIGVIINAGTISSFQPKNG